VAVTVSPLDGTVYVKLGEVTVPMLGEVHETKVYWHPVPQPIAERTESVCFDPTTKLVTRPVVGPILTEVPSILESLPEVAVKKLTVVFWKFAVSVTGEFMVRPPERLLPVKSIVPVPVHSKNL
jgi:hypothetical protein